MRILFLLVLIANIAYSLNPGVERQARLLPVAEELDDDVEQEEDDLDPQEGRGFVDEPPTYKVEESELGYIGTPQQMNLLDEFTEEDIKEMTRCSWYRKNPGTCNPKAQHGPCLYCKTRAYIQVLGSAVSKPKCPGDESFVDGLVNVSWRLTDKKFGSNKWRVCVVEIDPMKTEMYRNGGGGEVTPTIVGTNSSMIPPYLPWIALGLLVLLLLCTIGICTMA